MPAPISVVIPTLNAEKVLPGCAAALMDGVSEGLIHEMIITDGGSTDATVALGREIGAKIVTGPASRGGQLRRGCAAAQGEWLLIVHADTQLAPGWVEAVTQHMGTQSAGWGFLRFDRGGRFVAAWANLRAQLFGLPYGDQALLVPKSLYDAVGGYLDQPLMEDVAIARALRGTLVAGGFTAVTSAARYRRHGWLKRGTFNLSLLLRYLLGADPHRLAAAYRK